MESIATWPLLQRNKVEDSQIDTTVGVLAESENEVAAGLAKKVNHHSTLILVCSLIIYALATRTLVNA